MGDRVKGMVVIVTGAGSVGPGWGNGKADVVLCAREGAEVCAVDIDVESAKVTKAVNDEEGGECTFHRVDVSQSASTDVVRGLVPIAQQSIPSSAQSTNLSSLADTACHGREARNAGW